MITSILVFVLSLNTLAQEGKPDPRENISTAVKEAGRLLEAKEPATFLKQFVHPSDLKKILADNKFTLEEFAVKFSEAKGARLLAALQEISDKEPELLEEGTVALFKVDMKNAPGGRIVFQKSGKLWYIRN